MKPIKKYPLILEIHGGPCASYGPKFDSEKQLMAASGAIVLYTNLRGSTGKASTSQLILPLVALNIRSQAPLGIIPKITTNTLY